MKNKNSENSIKTILGIKPEMFWIYFFLIIAGLILLGVGLLIYFCCCINIMQDILIGLACGIISSAITAYFVELVATKEKHRILENEKREKQELKNATLSMIENGILWIMRPVIEQFIGSRNLANYKLIDCFHISIDIMEEWKFDYDDLSTEPFMLEKLQNGIRTGVTWCYTSCQNVIKDKTILMAHKIYSETEILALEFLLHSIDEFNGSSKLNEISEYLKLAVDNTIEKFDELKVKVSRIVEFRNNKIINWPSIMK